MAIPQEVLDYINNRVELKIHKIQITLVAKQFQRLPGLGKWFVEIPVAKP